MAPPKTTGKGKPAITPEEKARELGLSTADYVKRSVIGKQMRKIANDNVSKRTTGVKTTPTSRSEAFYRAWCDARAAIRAKYSKEELDRLKVNYKDPPAGSKTKTAKKKKSKTGKKGAVKKA